MKKCKLFNSQKGQTLMFAIIVVIVLLVFVSTLNRLLKHDTRLTIKHKRSTTAFHLAEAAADRGLWKLRESKDVWDSFAEGTVNGYNNDVTYTDIEGGTYKIVISTTSEENERKIIGRGRDSSTNEVRAIELIVEHVAVDAAIYSPTLIMSGNVKVHWGPIKSIGAMTADPSDYYPRKYAVGQIINRTPDGIGDDDTDGFEYWAHYNVPNPPGVDTQYYLDNADYYYGPVCDEWPVPTGSAPVNLKDIPTPIVDHTDPDKIYYIDGDCTLKNNYLKGTLIIMGNLTMGGGSKGIYTANIPENARDEYDSPNCTPADDMYGFPGPPTVLTQDFDTGGGKPGKVSFEGFIYIQGDWKGNGGGLINGCVQCVGSMAALGGNVDVFYNEDISKQVETTELNVVHVSWRELAVSW